MTDDILQITSKTCSTCKETKDWSKFSKDKSKIDGRCSQCKECQSLYKQRNKGNIAAQSRQYRQREQVGDRLRAQARGYYQENKEKIVARQREKYKDCYQQQRSELQYTLRKLLSKAKQRAKKASLPFDLTLEWLETMVISHCPITLQPIDWLKEEVTNGIPGPNSPSIDKNKPELGYVQTNCAIVSFRGNSIKSNGTIDEHRRVVQYMAAQQLRDTDF